MPLFEKVGHGAVLNNSPHDLAAVGLICSEAGAIFADGYGRTLEHRALLGSDHSYQMSCITAANAELHAKLVEAVDGGIAKLKAKFGKDG
jgi:fructose-1,6-bisphosphatase/inositol monophosphatase family enzyme